MQQAVQQKLHRRHFHNLLYEIQRKGEENERQGEPLSCLCKLCVPSLCFALAHKGFRTAGDGAGKSCAFAALKKNDDGNCKTGYELKNGENEFRVSIYISILSKINKLALLL